MSVKIVIAHHPYEASRDDEISFEKDEVIKVTDDTDPDWWVGKKKDGSLGFFPSNFVTVKEDNEPSATEKPIVDSDQVKEEQKVDTAVTAEENVSSESADHEKSEEETPAVEEKKVDQIIGMARVMEDYAMQEPGELTLPRGGIVNVYEIIDDEWSRGELNGKVGRYPSKYVEEIDMPGRPDLGRQQSAGSPDAPKSPQTDEDGSAPKGGFKLAAFGVKQGGIGSLLAGGFPGLKKAGAAKPETKPSPPEEKKEVITSTVEEKPKAAIESPISPTIGVPLVPAFTASEEESNPAASPASPTTEKLLGKAIVLHPYDADNEDELNLLRGEYVEILDRNADDGWWKGKNERGESGVFPCNFVKELEEDVIAPPTPTRARRSVNSTTSSTTPTENRSPSINSMAKPPQLPRPSSVQTPGTTKPVALNPRPSTINTPSTAIPPKPEAAATTTQSVGYTASPSIPESVEEAIKEEEQYEADEEKPTGSEMTSPVRSEVEESPLFVPKLAERNIVPSPTENEAEPVRSPPVVQEEPITDEEEKESGADEEVIPRENPTPQEPEVEIVEEPTISKVEVPKAEEPKVEESNVEKSRVEEPEVEEPEIEEPEAEERKVEPIVASKDSDKDEFNTPTKEIKQEEQTSVVVQEESGDEFKDATEESSPTASEEKPVVIEKEEPSKEEHSKEEPLKEEHEVPVVVEEEKNEFDSIPAGPKLTAPARVRIGAGRTRRSPQQVSQEPSQMEVLQKELESTPEEEVKKPVIPEKPVSPPAKPIKPIFAKFPTPFAAGAEEISKRHLKPTQTRRLWDEKPAEESQPTSTSTDEEPVRPSGVKNIASRFNFNGGGGSNEVLETKLKNHTKNEVEKVRKEFEQLLQEEREKRINLEHIVNELLEKVKALEN